VACDWCEQLQHGLPAQQQPSWQKSLLLLLLLLLPRSSHEQLLALLPTFETCSSPDACAGDFVVSGGADGLVRLYDSMLRMSAWFEHLEAMGAVTCVSFATKGQPRPQAEMQLNRWAHFAPPPLTWCLLGWQMCITGNSWWRLEGQPM
jgi:hypothetical protein